MGPKKKVEAPQPVVQPVVVQ